MARESLIFISYRRQDSSAAARWLGQTIRTVFGEACVFIDTDEIRIGEEWPKRIDQALESASVVIVVIGPNWLRITDEFGLRRLNKKDDWVRREILHATRRKLVVIPLLVSHASFLAKNGLPPAIAKLADYQAYELRDEHWDNDLRLILETLEQIGFKRLALSVRYPKPHVNLRELTPEEIKRALKQIPGWEIAVSAIPGKDPLKRSELRKKYEFPSFEAAIDFMTVATRHISRVNHHPRWGACPEFS